MGTPNVKGQMVRPVAQFKNAPTPKTLAISGTAAATAALGANEILVQTTTSCFFLVGSSAERTATPVTVSIGHFIPAGVAWPMLVDPEHVFQAITSGAAGSVYISAIS